MKKNDSCPLTSTGPNTLMSNDIFQTFAIRLI